MKQCCLLAGCLPFLLVSARELPDHKIVADFSKKVLGKEIAALVFKFNKIRKIRHYLIYGLGLSISGVDSRNAIASAVKFLKM